MDQPPARETLGEPYRATPDRPERTLPEGPPFAECVLCREPTEHPESTKGITLCPVCAWQEAQRSACSG